MNFFKLYIGDYQRDTAHLSVAEHGAYLLMLQHYYATEKPLPIGKALHRMLRAQDKAEREAIDSVASQFWRETVDGLVNDRADVEITKAGAQAETNRVIAQAREAKRKASRASNEQSTNRATNDQPNHNHSHSQTPDLNTHTESIHQPMARAPSLAGQVCMAMKAAGVPDVNPGHLDLLTLIEAGATLDEFIGAASEARAKSKGFAYAVGTVKRRREEAAKAAPLHQGAMPQRPPTQAELNTLAAGHAMGVYGSFDPNPRNHQQPETVYVESRLIAS